MRRAMAPGGEAEPGGGPLNGNAQRRKLESAATAATGIAGAATGGSGDTDCASVGMSAG